ncbi:MAG: transporter substrate-binding domain-containing protein [Myxococcota bacterium]
MMIFASVFVGSVGWLGWLGCVGGTPEVAPAPVAPAPPAEPVAVAPGVRPTGGLTALAKSTGVLKVAADPDAAPFLIKTATGYEGFEYALAQTIADGAELKLEIVPGLFTELPELVTSGRADLAIGQLSPSASYAGLAWSVSYLQYSLCLIVPAASPVKGMADLKGKRVGMYDDPVARQLANVLVGGSFDQNLFDDYGYFEKLVRGQLDAMVYDCPLARHEMKVYGDQLRIASDTLNVTTYNAAVRADDALLLGDVNRALKTLGEQGLLAKLSEQWLGKPAAAADFESATGKVVVLRAGDTLSLVAERELGSVEQWKTLYEANKDVIGADPDVVYVGMLVRIPPKP